MKWYDAKYFLPGSEYKPEPGYLTPEFIVIYHHGDNMMMINIAFWNGSKFIIGTTCYCDKCDCSCNYQIDYSDDCFVTHWLPIELPEFNMEIYFDEDA